MEITKLINSRGRIISVDKNVAEKLLSQQPQSYRRADFMNRNYNPKFDTKPHPVEDNSNKKSSPISNELIIELL